MDKQELLTALDGAFHLVGTPQLVREDASLSLNLYVVQIWASDGDALQERNLRFYVEDEGGEGEVAFYKDGVPRELDTSQSFFDEINDYIQAKIAAGAIDGGFVDDISEVHETAFARAYIVSGSDVEEKRVFINRNESGDLQHRQVV